MSTSLPKNIGKPATRALNGVGVDSLEKLTKFTAAELAALHGVGPKAIGILMQALKQHNLQFASSNSK